MPHVFTRHQAEALRETFFLALGRYEPISLPTYGFLPEELAEHGRLGGYVSVSGTAYFLHYQAQGSVFHATAYAPGSPPLPLPDVEEALAARWKELHATTPKSAAYHAAEKVYCIVLHQLETYIGLQVDGDPTDEGIAELLRASGGYTPRLRLQFEGIRYTVDFDTALTPTAVWQHTADASHPLPKPLEKLKVALAPVETPAPTYAAYWVQEERRFPSLFQAPTLEAAVLAYRAANRSYCYGDNLLVRRDGLTSDGKTPFRTVRCAILPYGPGRDVRVERY
jgi:hypothetical protein